MSNEPSVQVWVTLLKDFLEQVARRPERLPTFLEITRYPHYENVCSNILEFFLDPRKPHGLGTLFLDAIAHVGGIESQEGMWGSVEVTREERTEGGKSIDLLIRSDTHAVLIENKIRSGLDNPWADYARYLDRKQQEKKRHKFLITLNPVHRDTLSTIGNGFKNITHPQLVSEIRGLLGSHVAEADTRYLTFMLDFLKTLDNLPEDMVMDQKFLEFVKSHQTDVESLLAQFKELQRELRRKITQLEEMVDLSKYSKVSGGKERNPEEMWDSLVHKIEFEEDFKVCIQTWVSPQGWEITLWLEPETTEKARLPELLSNQGIDYGVKDGYPHRKCGEYDADLKDIADLLQDVVSKVAAVRNSGNY